MVDAPVVAAQVHANVHCGPRGYELRSPVAGPVAGTAIRRLSGQQKSPVSGTFLEADEGTRTLDLLHGKQTL
jgi:hypothetical protein